MRRRARPSCASRPVLIPARGALPARQSEFISQLLPLPLSLLNARLPLLLPPAHPSLLAQTVHQTLLFDDRMREKGFNAARTLAAKRGSWDGLTGEILRMGDVLNAWVEGERDCESPAWLKP